MQKKPLTKYNTPFMIIILEKIGKQGTYLNIIKAICNKPIANIKLSGEKFKTIPLKSGTRLNCPLSLYLFNTVLQFLPRVIRQQKWIKGTQTGKEAIKVSLFADNIIYTND